MRLDIGLTSYNYIAFYWRIQKAYKCDFQSIRIPNTINFEYFFIFSLHCAIFWFTLLNFPKLLAECSLNSTI